VNTKEKNLSINPFFVHNPFVLINMGVRFSSCMPEIDGITNKVNSTNFPCRNTANSAYIGSTFSEYMVLMMFQINLINGWVIVGVWISYSAHTHTHPSKERAEVT